jgi:hypothetical protein
LHSSDFQSRRITTFHNFGRSASSYFGPTFLYTLVVVFILETRHVEGALHWRVTRLEMKKPTQRQNTSSE